MNTVVTHKLPGDSGEGDIAWFDRMNDFEQEETRRQAHYKRAHWPDLSDGRRQGRTYPHILPDGHQEKALFDAFVIPYMQAHDIAFHAEFLNLRSSQACCLNFLFPLRGNLELASRVLRIWLPGLDRVTGIEFEYTGPEAVTDWLGEPPGGKRGLNRTSVDAAVWWADGDRQPRLTLLEWKYTEKGFGSCGGYGSRGNPDPERCRTLDVRSIDPPRDCYLVKGDTARTRRRYWEHMQDGGIRVPEFVGKGCPLRGPLYQLIRLQLLAHWLATNTRNRVEVAVACFQGNTALMRSPPYLKYLDPHLPSVWQSLLPEPNKFRVLLVQDLMAHCDYLPDVAKSPWRRYLGERYGV